KGDGFHPCRMHSGPRVSPPSFWFRRPFIACRGRLGGGHPAPACSPLLAVARGETGDRSPRLGPPARGVSPGGDSSPLSHTWGLTAAAYSPASAASPYRRRLRTTAARPPGAPPHSA